MITKITKKYRAKRKHAAKIAVLIALTVLLATAGGCGGTVVEIAPSPDTTTPSPNPAQQSEPDSETAGGNHHDFSALGGPVLHAAFTNLEQRPETFAGDRITVRAEYLVLHNPDKSLPCQHFLFVLDATGCCPVMIRIKYRDNNCPDDYPENLSVIEAYGIFRPFERDGRVIYHYLAVERLTVVG